MKLKELWEAENNIRTATNEKQKLQLEIIYYEKMISYYESEECETRIECRPKHIGKYKKMIERRINKIEEMEK